MSSNRAHDIARTILDGFDKHYRLFREVAAHAKERFEHADWAGVREAARIRIDMYDRRVTEAFEAVQTRFPSPIVEEVDWQEVKREYIALLYGHKQPECAETFYNSVACRVLDRTYYRNEYIFWRPAVSTEFIDAEQPTYRCFYPAAHGLRRTLRAIVESFELKLPFEDLGRDLRNVVRALRAHFGGKEERAPNFHVQVLSSLFYRNKGAYIVGRIINGHLEHPFAVPVRHAVEGKSLALDALLLKPEHIGTLFSLARAYFMVDMDVPSAWVSFLRQLMPTKSRAELYTAVGLQKQGKTLFYRDLQQSLKHSTDSFVIAPGARGLVMMVFTLPSFPYVFKVIRDEFGPPKQITREEVMAKYLLVKYHDRVGRMADTLEYSQVAFPIARMDPKLMEELERSCASSLERDGDRVVIKHMYIERRVTPLDLWLRGASEERARTTIMGLGAAIRELAEANIFPGDLLLKNFGITRWGRVVFYDYDEVQYLTDVCFRKLPPPRDYDEEIASEPWFPVRQNDIFPEELPQFLFPPGRQRELFLTLCGELTDPEWWQARQEEVRAGKQRDLYPYPDEIRFK
jgi:isocitrate dehydrogenase kinase/phosphatase